MKRIGLLSDTHAYLDNAIFTYFAECDEIWHAGDWGSIEVSDKLKAFKTLRGVYGNIDDKDIRMDHPKINVFEIEGVKVVITHIGGYPSNYERGIKELLKAEQPNLFICGHSHILKVLPDKQLNILHMNPGAAGKHGFHTIRTCLRFEINNGKIENLQAIELGKRA